MSAKREAIEFLNGMREQFIGQKKNKNSSDLKVISAIALVCGMAEEYLNTPKHETVEQWKNRTGESYPDDGPVWTFSPCEKEWQLYSLKELEHTICETVYVANHHGKPEIGE
ncbi:MAG: hypothetical protein GY928_21500 [Colwellia sp.]|nr:hypothetical protein [Colwellia sp.]